ncbi:MAG: sigma-70 family RNA polymerase sigma factor [Clostridiales bacterium]|nr:sigma-70 family RNA polymerase sigma factor [Clostridiales bacterium]
MLMLYLSMIETEAQRALFTDLYEKYRFGLFRQADKYLHDAYDAEDAVHDVFCVVADEYISVFENKSEEYCRRFLFVAVKNRAINIGRKKARVVSLDALRENGDDLTDAPKEDPIGKMLSEKDLLEKAKEEIKKLEPRYGDVLWMQLTGCPVKTIARFFGERPVTITKRLYRAKLMLRQAVCGEGGAA